MKDGTFHVLYMHPPNKYTPQPNHYETNEDYKKAYTDYLTNMQQETKEVCPSCKKIFDKMFEYRLQGMCKLTEECEDLFNLPPRESRADREKKKSKKNKPIEGNK
jgi:hypothetical protein